MEGCLLPFIPKTWEGREFKKKGCGDRGCSRVSSFTTSVTGPTLLGYGTSLSVPSAVACQGSRGSVRLVALLGYTFASLCALFLTQSLNIPALTVPISLPLAGLSSRHRHTPRRTGSSSGR